MKLALTLAALTTTCLISSCGLKTTACSSRCEEYYRSIQTAQQGEHKAKADIITKGYAIYRYDMPPFRTGYWEPYYARFKHFGIKELSGGYGFGPTLEYMKAYNRVMDNGLKHRYGHEYMKYRHKLLPPQGSTLFKYSNKT